MHMKRTISVLLILFLLLPASSACTPKSSVTIGVSNGYIGNNWRTQMLEDIQAAYEGYKKDGVISNLIVQNAGLDINNQIAQIRNMIKSGVDLLLIDPNSETALNPVIEEAYKKGIPVIAFDQPVSSPYAINVVIDQQKWGEEQAKWLVGELGGKGEIVIIEGLEGHPANENRMIGIRRILKKYPEIKVVTTVHADWDQTNAQYTMSNLLYTYPNIDGVLTQDGMALGVLRAYNTAEKKIPMVTGETMTGFLRVWKDMDEKNGFSSFAQNNPPGISRTALGIAVRLLQGKKLKPLPDNTFFYPVRDIVTNENLQEYMNSNQDKPDTYFLDEWLSEKELDDLFSSR